MRRSTFTDQPVTYAAVGATLDHDLTIHPPKGYRPSLRTIRLGSGLDRFDSSARALMTWGVQRGSGVEVTEVGPGTGEDYAGIRFADDGTPERLEPHHGRESVFDEDGKPYIANGMTAVLRVPFGPFHVHAPVRVVYVIEDENRVGFAYGTMHGHPLSGEESFLLEHRDDDSVWFTLRSFSRHASGARALVGPIARTSQRRLAARYLRALHPVTGNPAVTPSIPVDGPDATSSTVEVTADVTLPDPKPLTGGENSAVADNRSEPVRDEDREEEVGGAEHTADR